MDKRVILAVAGSGKTTHIVESLDMRGRSLLLTYTQNNLESLRRKIVEEFGFFPEKVDILTYFRFLYAFCFRPFLWLKYNAKGICWKLPPPWTMRISRSDRRYYFDRHGRVYYNRIAKLLEVEGVLATVNARLEKYYDHMFIDEVQDFSGHDFNLLKSLAKAKVGLTFVGDFYQHTFDTSRDGAVNRNLHAEYETYVSRFRDMGLETDSQTLNRSWRCSPSLCEFVSQRLGIEMHSHRSDETKICLVKAEDDVRRLIEDGTMVKLFYQKHYTYRCRSRNWGDSKGSDHYDDVCVVLNKSTLQRFISGDLRSLKPQTRNKLYVACSRAKKDLFFIPEKLCKSFRYP